MGGTANGEFATLPGGAAARRASVRQATYLGYTAVAVVASSVLFELANEFGMLVFGARRGSVLASAATLGATLLAAGAAVAFLAWVHQTVTNTVLFGRRIGWTPWQAVFNYIIPILFWFRPYSAMKAVLAASDPTALPDAPVYREREAPDYRGGTREALSPPRWSYPAPVLLWWLLFNLRHVIPNVAALVLDVEPSGSLFLALAVSLDVAAAVACALVVHAVNARQRELSRRLDAALAAS
jgi:hypothetical protein